MLNNFRNKRGSIKVIIAGVTILLLVVYFLSAFKERQAFIDKYNTAVELMNAGDYLTAMEILKPLGNYRDCLSYIEQAENWLIFQEAENLFDAERFDEALVEFSRVSKVKEFEGVNQANEYIHRIEEIQKEQQTNEKLYNEATNYYANGQYDEALSIFQKLGNYDDSLNMVQECLRLSKIQNRLDHATTLLAGIRYSMAIKQGGKVVFAGNDFEGRAEVEAWEDIISVAGMGEFVMGLKSDGTVVVARGETTCHVNTSEWRDIVAIAAGQQFIVGLKEDGTLTAQGLDGYGETNVSKWTNIAEISAGWQHVFALDKEGNVFDEEGNVYIAGYRSQVIENEIKKNPSEWTNLTSISTGGSSPGYDGNVHVVGLKSDGTAVAAGDNSWGQCNVYGTDWTNLIAIAAGDYHTVGLKADGTIITTLDSHNDINELVKEKTNAKFVDIAAGYGETLGLTEDGFVVGVGLYKEGQLDVGMWEDIVHYE